MAHNEEKYKYSRLIFSNACSAQSTLEFAVVFLILFFMILGIFELGFMWHQNNSVEFAAQDLSANLALLENWGCNDASTPDIVARKTSILASGVNLTFNSNTENFVTTYESEQLYGGKPFVRVKINCTPPNINGGSTSVAPVVQIQSVHKLLFMGTSLPNFRTGERIVIIPDNVTLTSTQKVTVGQR
ncbi:pilus assembly protein [bacterium]|nr:pilus assembly protein [bacterium]